MIKNQLIYMLSDWHSGDVFNQSWAWEIPHHSKGNTVNNGVIINFNE